MELVRKALEMAHHELTTLGGMMAFDAEDPSDTITIDPSDALEAIEQAMESMNFPVTEASLDAVGQEGSLRSC